MYHSSFQVQGNFEDSSSIADAITTRTMMVDNLPNSTYNAEQSLAVIPRQGAPYCRYHETLKGGGEAVWLPNLETALMTDINTQSMAVNDLSFTCTYEESPKTTRQRSTTTDLQCYRILREFVGIVWPHILEEDFMTSYPVCTDKPRAHTRHHPNPPRQLCFLIVTRIAGSKKHRNIFTKSFSEKERRSEAQVISDYLADLLRCEGGTLPRDDKMKLVRLSYKIAQATQAYPKHLLLREISMESQPFAGGGFADVYKGKYGDREVCVKQLRVFDKKVRFRLMTAYIREFILWSYMSHENVLPFCGLYLGDPESRICLVSPFMKNGNMEVFLRKKPRTPRLPLVLNIIEGLLYLHSSKVVHGDLKAQNILISDEGRALLADFGLSYVSMTSGVRGSSDFMATGTANWMAPELMEDDSAIPTRQSDIWSFGCLCYEIFTGRYPFYQCKSRARVLYAVLSGTLPARPESAILPGKLDDWAWELMTSHCWRRRPQERSTSEVIRDMVAKHSM